uniref:Ion transport domain-containing protein n=1 Tax=Ditylum brightwellii TaxID=49249 RepID=A0A7S4V4K6_9STRA
MSEGFQDEPVKLSSSANNGVENNSISEDGAREIPIDYIDFGIMNVINGRGDGAMNADDLALIDSAVATDDPDVTHLYTICKEALDQHNQEKSTEIWGDIREWFAAHPMPEEQTAAVTYRGDHETTVLQIVCKFENPPTDIVRKLIDCSPETVTWDNSSGQLPLHHACAYGASYDVISLLERSYPASTVAKDNRGRTPLHFAFTATVKNNGDGDDGNVDRNDFCDTVRLLSDSGAAFVGDENGMLPMHYACAYGTSAAALQILFDTHPNSIFANEDKGRTPLHFAMVNAHRPMSPSVVAFLLSVKDTDIINIPDNSGDLPLSLFAKAVSFDPYAAEKNENAFKCLELYINAKPHPTAEFYEALFAITSHNKKLSHEIRKRCFRTYLATKPLVGKEFFDAIKRLPTWLQIEAFISPSSSMMEYLNSKTSEPIPTMMLMLDFTFLVLLVVFFQLSANETIDCLFDNKGVGDSFPAYLGVLLTISIYLCVKEIMQIIRYFKAGSLRTLWFSDVKNILDVCLVVVTFLWCSVMFQCIQEDQSFDSSGKEWYKAAMAFTVLLYTLTFLLFLKSVLIDFAVFVSGMTNVIRNLLTFLVSLMIVLLAFVSRSVRTGVSRHTHVQWDRR